MSGLLERLRVWLQRRDRRAAKACLRELARTERRDRRGGTYWHGEYRGWFELTRAERDEVAQGRKTVSGIRARSGIHKNSPVVK